ncbi:hypothetical protein TNCV_1791551 [Trichonephila clavipes]|nr:hypothetical protein TNCV_1791551 [Trichonephila clavipes]
MVTLSQNSMDGSLRCYSHIWSGEHEEVNGISEINLIIYPSCPFHPRLERSVERIFNLRLGEKRRGGEKKGDGKREERESGDREESSLDGEKGLVRDWSGKTMNAGGVENRI